MLDAIHPDKSPSEVRADISAERLSMLDGLKVGTPAKLVVYGIVTSVSQSEGYGSEAAHGYVTVEIDKLAIGEDVKNEFAQLMNDDD